MIYLMLSDNPTPIDVYDDSHISLISSLEYPSYQMSYVRYCPVIPIFLDNSMPHHYPKTDPTYGNTYD
jgi:hypothetical protein